MFNQHCFIPACKNGYGYKTQDIDKIQCPSVCMNLINVFSGDNSIDSAKYLQSMNCTNAITFNKDIDNNKDNNIDNNKDKDNNNKDKDNNMKFIYAGL